MKVPGDGMQIMGKVILLSKELVLQWLALEEGIINI